MDLHDHLEQIAGPVPAPTAAQADADVARGRRALLRRRAGQTAAGSAFGIAALVAAFSVATSNTGAGPHDPAAGTSQSTVVAAQLVAYKGAQPKGFTIDKVPAGFYLQSSDNDSLLLAPKGLAPEPSDAGATVFVGKIAIMLESKDQHGPGRDGTKVKVGDHDGVLLKSLPAQNPDGTASAPADGDTGYDLWVAQPSGVYLIIQFWEGLGLSRNQMVELGAGVHVHADAQQGVG